MNMEKIFVLLTIILLAGCVSTSTFSKLGKEQALDGYTQLDRLGVKKKTLQRKVTQEEYQEYLSGYESSLPEFCKLDNAKKFALEGKPYNGSCDEIEPKFRTVYDEMLKTRSPIENKN
ncbi:MAG: hypothetical protein ACJAS1_001791 [Oleiphilaceae bacterium]|jgi:hypothetical protein